MKQNYKKLGDIVSLVDERNKSLETTEVLGINIDKEFMVSVANTIGTDLSHYKLLTKNTFACNPMHVGRDKRLPVSLYIKEKSAIVSPAYFIFRVKNKNEILPEFLNLFFKRDDFDRNCWFKTDGSVRGGITWEDFCDMLLPIPPMEEQQKIVAAYNAIENRIKIKQKINENLEKTAQTIYKKMFVENKEKLSSLSEIYQFHYGKGNTNPDNGGEYPVYGSNGIIGYYTEWNAEDIPIIGHIGSCGSLCFAFGKCYVTYNGIMCNIIDKRFKYFGYYSLKNLNLLEQVRGSTQPFISYDMLYDMKIFIPKEEENILQFEAEASKIMNLYDKNTQEISQLAKLKQLVISQIA